MAGQPDISAILAALGGQGGGTPANGGQPAPQAPPPGAPGTYPGAPPIQSPPNSLGGLPLPQPSSSGSLDLSSIKPMNSGSVSLADAIAKAREKAQSRTDSRTYRRSRSRSRSPPRRDNFRDNYNPYRDERREDRGRASNGRDRSLSPQRRGGALSPSASRNSGYDAGRIRSPASNNETGSEVITVASSDVGLIIGRAGENLKRVETQTGARVQFLSGPDNSGPLRQCRISGTVRQREEAKADIFRVAQDNPNSNRQSASVATGRTAIAGETTLDDNSLQIMVPDKTVGLIIGRGGETIRDLQDRSGCHVNITAEDKSINGLRPVNLIGTHESQMKAKEMIMEVVQSDTRGEGDGGAQRGGQSSRSGGGNGAGSGYDTYGAQAQYGAQPDPYGGGGGGGGGGDSKINETIQVVSEAVGMIIGKGGETIKDMQNQSGCKINVSPPSGADIQRDIGLIGTRQAIEGAKRLIFEKVDAVRAKQGGRTRADDQRASYGANDPYSQQQAASYNQNPYAAQSNTPGAPAGGAAAAAAPSSADPYAAYGGYQAYLAMWYAAAAAQGQQGGAPPPA